MLNLCNIKNSSSVVAKSVQLKVNKIQVQESVTILQGRIFNCTNPWQRNYGPALTSDIHGSGWDNASKLILLLLRAKIIN